MQFFLFKTHRTVLYLTVLLCLESTAHGAVIPSLSERCLAHDYDACDALACEYARDDQIKKKGLYRKVWDSNKIEK